MRERFIWQISTDLLSTGPLVTRRFFRLLACQLLLLLACALPAAHADDTVEITRNYIEAAEEGYRLSAAYSFELNHGLEDALQHGLSLYFTTEVELTRPRWYWVDEKAVSVKRTAKISYNVLTRQYHVGIVGSVQQSFAALEDALFLIRRPSRWVVAPRGALKIGEVYNVSLRMRLDRDFLPKPIQVNAFNNSEWRLETKKTFQYRAE
ncbi:DUF4390 domain-containing protein [Pseudoduganella namucuonensis]|uniref:DUF4390 domain-containing protein n=1 Tax=Pseudoduganella namucuonensis TaxID=1035707 RepID=UPI000B8595A4|nr:DUF4390 domain-containing protein [Pseudoduganella namucuonensis]